MVQQQERGVDVTTQSWREAIGHAEGLVEITERKLVRDKNAHTCRVAKYEVNSSIFSHFFPLPFAIPYLSTIASSQLRVRLYF
jgi:hypothetical protein